MNPLILLGLLAVAFVLLFVSLRRATVLFIVRVERGHVRLTQGRIPPRLFSDIEDIVRNPPQDQIVLKAVLDDGKPRIQADGKIDPGTLQQIRNVLGSYEVAQIRAGSRRARS